jgi:tetratricopeptide (TPR) repeat protein
MVHGRQENTSPAIAGSGAPGRKRLDCATGIMTAANPTEEDEPWPASQREISLLCPGGVLAAAPAPKKAADPEKDAVVCEDADAASKARVAACTRAIKSGAWPAAELAWAYAGRGQAHFFAGDKEKAIADYTRAVEIDPKDAAAYVSRGYVYKAKSDWANAIADITRAIALAPKKGEFYGDRAMVYLANGDIKNAIADLNKNHDLTPGMNEATFKQRLCLMRAQGKVEFELAHADCSAAIKLKPDDTHAWEFRGYLHLRFGKLKEACADYDQALSFDAKNGVALYGRAIINKREGKLEESNADLKAAKAIVPTVPPAYVAEQAAADAAKPAPISELRKAQLKKL